jgi:phosphoglycerate dehydrogenase-like enzyme
MEHVVVAGPASVGPSLERLRGEGLLPDGVTYAPLDADGRPTSPGGDEATVLWSRRDDAWGRWFGGALDSLLALRWLHVDTVGIDYLPMDRLVERGVLLTNGSGNFARPMAEWVLLAMLAAAKRLPWFVRRSDAGTWDPSPTLRELDGTVALLLGFGATNRIVAELAAPFGVEVRAAVRRPRERVPDGVAKLVVGDAWREELPEADWVVLGLPATGATRGMIDAGALAAMREDAWLVNVARGALVNEDALAEALDAGRIGGAVLDAFVTEPLPADSPLWRRDNVVVVPHHTWSRAPRRRGTRTPPALHRRRGRRCAASAGCLASSGPGSRRSRS